MIFNFQILQEIYMGTVYKCYKGNSPSGTVDTIPKDFKDKTK